MESAQLDGSSFQNRLAVARGLLKRSRGPDPAWPVAAAAALMMVSALALAAAVITTPAAKFAPSSQFTPVPVDKHG